MKKVIALSIVLSTTILLGKETVLDEVTISTATKTEKHRWCCCKWCNYRGWYKKNGFRIFERYIKCIRIKCSIWNISSASSISKSSVSIRGLGAKGTLFLLDGRRLSGEVANPYDLDRIPASQIEKQR